MEASAAISNVDPAAIQERMDAAVEARDRARRTRSALEQRREIALAEGASDEALEGIDADLAKARRAYIRERDRLKILNEQLEAAESDREEDQCRRRLEVAAKLRGRGLSLLKEYGAGAEALRRTLQLMTAIDSFLAVELSELGGGAECLHSLNVARQEPADVIPGKTELIDQNVYQPPRSGNPTLKPLSEKPDLRKLDPDGPLPAGIIKRVTPEQRTGGRQLQPLQGCVVLPPEMWAPRNLWDEFAVHEAGENYRAILEDAGLLQPAEQS